MVDPKPNILVVDDDKTITELMRDFLEAEGFSVETAHDSSAALTLLEHATINCLLLDVMMPGQSGFELCRHIRETSDIPILFLSARDSDMDKICRLLVARCLSISLQHRPYQFVPSTRPARGPERATTEIDLGQFAD